MNFTLFTWINQGAGLSPALDLFGILGTKIGVFLPALYIAWCCYQGIVNKNRDKGILAWRTILFVGICLLTAGLFSFLYWEPRPFIAHPNEVHLLISHKPSNSFPSNHMAFVLAFSMPIWYHMRRLGLLCILDAIWVAWSRIFVGHHYPGDILMSTIIVLAWYYVFSRYIWPRAKKRVRRTPRPTPAVDANTEVATDEESTPGINKTHE